MLYLLTISHLSPILLPTTCFWYIYIYMFYYSETFPVNHNILQHCIYFMIHMIKSFSVIYKTQLQVFLCLSWSLHLYLQHIYCVICFIPIVKNPYCCSQNSIFTSVNIPSFYICQYTFLPTYLSIYIT